MSSEPSLEEALKLLPQSHGTPFIQDASFEILLLNCEKPKPPEEATR